MLPLHEKVTVLNKVRKKSYGKVAKIDLNQVLHGNSFV